MVWLRNASRSPKADNVVHLVERLRFLMRIGIVAAAKSRIHEDRFEQFVREGRISDAHQLQRDTAHRRRAILAASVIDLESRLTDELLDMTDKLILGMFSWAQKSTERRYVSSTWDVSRLMRLFDGTINALEIARMVSVTASPWWMSWSDGPSSRAPGATFVRSPISSRKIYWREPRTAT